MNFYSAKRVAKKFEESEGKLPPTGTQHEFESFFEALGCLRKF